MKLRTAIASAREVKQKCNLRNLYSVRFRLFKHLKQLVITVFPNLRCIWGVEYYNINTCICQHLGMFAEYVFVWGSVISEKGIIPEKLRSIYSIFPSSVIIIICCLGVHTNGIFYIQSVKFRKPFMPYPVKTSHKFILFGFPHSFGSRKSSSKSINCRPRRRVDIHCADRTVIGILVFGGRSMRASRNPVFCELSEILLLVFICIITKSYISVNAVFQSVSRKNCSHAVLS